MALPEQAAGKRLQRRIQAHQGEPAQFGLGSKEPIKGIAMGHGVKASMEAMPQGDRQLLKALSGEQLGQIIEQFAGRRQLAEAHLGGDLPASRRTHMHAMARISNRLMGSWREAIGLGQPPEQGMGVEQQLRGMARAHSNGCSIAASSSSGSDSSSCSRGGRFSRPASTPGMRRAAGCSSGTSRAQGLPPLATTIVSPAWAASIRREKWVLASCTFTTRRAGAVTGRREGEHHHQVSPLLDQAGGQG